MQNPAASSCSDTSLLRVLKKYDDRQHTVLLEELPEGTTFLYGADRLFVKGEQIRKRFKCKEVKTRRMYLFNPLAEVTAVEQPVEEKKKEFFNIFNLKK
jgi:SprT protein